MEKIFEIESWEPRFEKYDDSVKQAYHDKMTYRVKVIGNANKPFKTYHSIDNPFETRIITYILSGLTIQTSQLTIHSSDGYVSEQPINIEIRNEEDIVVYRSFNDPIDGEWKKTFEELFKSSLKLTQEDNQKVYTKKQER